MLEKPRLFLPGYPQLRQVQSLVREQEFAGEASYLIYTSRYCYCQSNCSDFSLTMSLCTGGLLEQGCGCAGAVSGWQSGALWGDRAGRWQQSGLWRCRRGHRRTLGQQSGSPGAVEGAGGPQCPRGPCRDPSARSPSGDLPAATTPAPSATSRRTRREPPARPP